MEASHRNVPVVFGALGALVLWFGAEVDIAWHVDVGRDTFFTPPHLLIIGGIATVGFAALIWLMPVGGFIRKRVKARPGLVLAGTCAALQGIGLAVDNWWHGVFGRDVTLWSPPHLLLIFVGWLAVLGLIADYAAGPRPRPLALLGAAGVSMGLVTLVLAEYEYGVPHFRMVWFPIVLAGLIGACLPLARRLTGIRWAGTATAVLALALRGAGVVFNSLLGRSIPVPPLGLLAGGIAFDLLLLGARARPSRARLLVAVAGAWAAAFAAEIPWLRFAGKTWWPTAILLPGFLAGLGAALVSAMLGMVVGGLLARTARFRATPSGPIDDAPPAASASRRVAAAVLVGGLALLVAGPALATTSARGPGYSAGPDPRYREATVTLSLGQVRVEVKRAKSGDFLSVMAWSRRPGVGVKWVGGAAEKDGAFTAPLSQIAPGYILWLVDGDAAFANSIDTTKAGQPYTLLLEQQTARRPSGFRRWLTPVAYAAVAGLLAAGVAVAAAMLRRGATAP